MKKRRKLFQRIIAILVCLGIVASLVVSPGLSDLSIKSRAAEDAYYNVRLGNYTVHIHYVDEDGNPIAAGTQNQYLASFNQDPMVSMTNTNAYGLRLVDLVSNDENFKGKEYKRAYLGSMEGDQIYPILFAKSNTDASVYPYGERPANAAAFDAVDIPLMQNTTQDIYLVYGDGPNVVPDDQKGFYQDTLLHMYLFDYSAQGTNHNGGGMWTEYRDGDRVSEYSKKLPESGFPRYANPDATINNADLAKYFDPDGTTDRVTGDPGAGQVRYVGPADGLLIRQEDGKYTYDSAENAAYYDSETGEFVVYDEVVNPRENESRKFTNGGNDDDAGFHIGSFLPLNDIDASKVWSYSKSPKDKSIEVDKFSAGDPIYGVQGTTNYHFGMYMEGYIYQPDPEQDGEDVEYPTFYIRGDDDILVYIDDVLVLDIGGIHDAFYGTIDFGTGKVEYLKENDKQGTVGGAIKVETTLRELMLGEYDPSKLGINYSTYKYDGVKGNVYNYNTGEVYREYDTNPHPYNGKIFYDFNDKNKAGEDVGAGNGDSFADGTIHSIKVFYAERGEGASNLRMEINVAQPALSVTNSFWFDESEDVGIDVDNPTGEKFVPFGDIAQGGNVANTIDKARYTLWEIGANGTENPVAYGDQFGITWTDPSFERGTPWDKGDKENVYAGTFQFNELDFTKKYKVTQELYYDGIIADGSTKDALYEFTSVFVDKEPQLTDPGDQYSHRQTSNVETQEFSLLVPDTNAITRPEIVFRNVYNKVEIDKNIINTSTTTDDADTYISGIETPVTDKTQMKKAEGVSVGDIVTFQVEVNVPNYSNYDTSTKHSFQIVDTLDPELEFVDGSVRVYKEMLSNQTIGKGSEKRWLVSGTDYKATVSGDKKKLTVDLLDIADVSQYRITLIYQAKVVKEKEQGEYFENKVQANYTYGSAAVGQSTTEVRNVLVTPKKEEVALDGDEIEVTTGDNGLITGPTVTIGSDITYRIYWNNYEQESAKITITDTLDQGVDYKADSAKAYIITEENPDGKEIDATFTDGATLTWILNNQPANSKGYVEFTVTVNKDAINTWDYENGAGTGKDNLIHNKGAIQVGNDANAKIETNEVQNPVELPEITIEKTQSVNKATETKEKQQVYAYDEVTYYLTVKNVGKGEAKGVVVLDAVPTGLTLVEDNPISDGGTETNGVITWNVGNIAAGESVKVSFTVKVPLVTTDKTWKNIGHTHYSNNPDNPDDPSKSPADIKSNEVEIEEKVPVVAIVKEQSVNGGTKTGLKQQVNADDEVTYYLTVKNSGNEEAKNVVITDTIPAGLTLVEKDPISNGGKEANGVITWNIASIGAGKSATVSFTVKVPVVTEDTSWKNVGHTHYGNNPNNPVDPKEPPADIKSNEVEIEEQIPVVAIVKEQSVNGGTKTGLKQQVNADDEVTYYLTIENTGNGEAKNVVVTDTIPAGLTLVEKDPISNGGTEANGVITWNIASIASGASVTVSFTVKVPVVTEDTSWKNIAAVTAENDPTTQIVPGTTVDPKDPHHGRKTKSSNEVEIEEKVIEEKTPDVTITKAQSVNGGAQTTDKLQVNADDEVTYYLTVTNSGDGDAIGVVVTDAIPAGLTLVEGTISNGGTEANSVITWNIASIGAGESVTVSFKVKVPVVTEDTTWKNIGHTHYDNNPEDSEDPNDPPTDIPTDEVEIEEKVVEEKTPDVTIIKEQSVNGGAKTTDKLQVNANDKVTYYLTVTNNGDGDAMGVVVTDAVPAGLTLVEDSISNGGTEVNGVITWNIASIGAGESVTVSFTVKVPVVTEDTSWKNIGHTHYDNNPEDSEDPDDPPTDIPTDEVEIVEKAPAVVIEKAQSVNGGAKTKETQQVNGNDKVTYYLTVTNNGEGDAIDVVVTDAVPAGLTLVEDTISDDGTEIDGVITWNLGTIAAGKSVTVSFTVTVPVVTEDTTWKNIGYMHYDNNLENSEDPDDPPADVPSDEVEIEEHIPTPNVTIIKEQSVNGGAKKADKLQVNANDKVTYYLTVTNNGDGDATDVVVTDAVPAGLTLVANTISNGGTEANGVITWNLGTIAAGKSVTVRFTVTVPAVTEDTTWKNIGHTHYGNNPENPEDPDDPPTDIPSDEVEIEEKVVEEKTPDITIVKEQSVNDGTRTTEKLQVDANDEVMYYLTVTNSGDGDALGIVITDAIPAGLILVENSISDGGVETDGVITWNIASLGAGASKTVSFKVEVPAVTEDTSWKNIGHAYYDNNPENPEDPNEPPADITTSEVEIEEKVVPDDPEKGDLLIIVIDEETGDRVPNATVTVTYPDGTKEDYVTDENGEIFIPDLEPGTFDVTVKKVPEGYTVTTGKTAKVEVEAGKTAIHEAYIIPSRDSSTSTPKPETGDAFNMIIPIVMILVSLAGIAVLAIRRRKR